MRVLVATDGSDRAIVAVRAAAELAGEPGSVFRAVSVVSNLVPVPGAVVLPHDMEHHEAALREARDVALRHDLQLDLRHGDPADEIITAATEFGADVVVLGSRGHGPLATIVLGSVSAAVADGAPCPVLVVRGPTLEPIVLATDGSEAAFHAEQVLHWWPRRTVAPVRVITVCAPRGEPVDLPAGAATAAASRLLAWGVPAESVVARGDPAHAIVRAAVAAGAGLVVVGTRGRTRIVRLVLGSVAHAVLTHAPSSVLVVPPTPARSREAVRQRGRRAVLARCG